MVPNMKVQYRAQGSMGCSDAAKRAGACLVTQTSLQVAFLDNIRTLIRVHAAVRELWSCIQLSTPACTGSGCPAASLQSHGKSWAIPAGSAQDLWDVTDLFYKGLRPVGAGL